VSFACTDPHRCTAENDLPSGVVYWKVTVPNAPDSATWELFVPPTDIGVVDSHYPGPLDLDGDGVPDTAVGVSGGGVGVYLGGAAGLQAAPMVLTSSDDPRNHFGYVVTAAGDLNGDGFGDLAVGECGGSGTRVYVYFGGAGGLGAKPQALDSPDGKNGFGCRVAAAGDLDADGYADLAVARVGDDFGGGLYIYRGSANGLITTTTRLDSPDQKPSRLGYSLAGLGDFDGDGFDDLAATEIDYSALTGRLHVYRGGPGGISNMQQTTRVSTDGMGLQFGASVACAGDMDRDGLPDLVVGSPAVSSTAGSPTMHVLYGGSMDEVVIQSTQAPGFAFEVEGGGDLDGDGYSDVVVSANDNVSVLLGGPTRLLTMVTAVGASAQGANPRHAAFAGDLDGDGKGDFLVADGAGVEVMLGGAGGLDRGRAMSVAAPPGGFAGAVR
jgi:hypothetical protein